MNLIEIKLPKYLLVLTQEEMLALLKANPVLWSRVIRRGKILQRARAAERRQPKCGTRL